ncbi:MAG: hypothetical protein OEM79_07045 [Nitrosopumilus sp.]|nr:hypothetical protein [Nitrosopumilus sp.]
MDEINEQKNNSSLEVFNSEATKLQGLVNNGLDNFKKLDLSEIIELYYQVINVTSLAKFLKQNFEETENSKFFVSKIQEIEKFNVEKFDNNLHPSIMSNLKKLIENSMKNLKDMTSSQKDKTKEEMENQAKMYENLRKIMSTKEFVEQYDIGIKKTLEDK